MSSERQRKSSKHEKDQKENMGSIFGPKSYVPTYYYMTSVPTVKALRVEAI